MSEPLTSALRHSHDRLADVGRGLDPGQLRGPSYDAEWNVAQVFSHLGSGAEIFDLLMAASLAGDPMPGPAEFAPIWERWNAKSPDDQAADAMVVDEALVARFEGLTADEEAALHFSFAGMEVDADRLETMRLGEHALHSWDVLVAFDPAATVSADAVDLLIDGLGQLVARAGKPAGDRLLVDVRTTGPDRAFSLVIDDAVSLGDPLGGAADGELELPAEAWLRLVYGRLDAEHTPAEVTVRGAVELDRLRQVFPGF